MRVINYTIDLIHGFFFISVDFFFFTQIWNKRDDFTLQKLKLEQKFIQNELENLFFQVRVRL